MPTFAIINPQTNIVENTLIASNAEVIADMFPSKNIIEVTAETGKPIAGEQYLEGVFLTIPKPFNSWVIDKENFAWKAPVSPPSPSDDKVYSWDEDTLSWIESIN